MPVRAGINPSAATARDSSHDSPPSPACGTPSPLDYEPGSRWQSSNTGYVIAGLIVEQANGFTVANAVYPDDRAAIVILVNQDASRATEQFAERLVEFVFDDAQATDDARTAQANAIFAGLQQGRLYRALFTANANDAKFAGTTLRVWTYETSDGKLEQNQVAVKE